jgi:antitoxin Phd
LTNVAHISISSARDSFSDVLEMSRTEAVVLERAGRPAAVLISPEQYEKMVDALDDAEDVDAFDAALQEDGPNVLWRQRRASHPFT